MAIEREQRQFSSVLTGHFPTTSIEVFHNGYAEPSESVDHLYGNTGARIVEMTEILLSGTHVDPVGPRRALSLLKNLTPEEASLGQKSNILQAIVDLVDQSRSPEIQRAAPDIFQNILDTPSLDQLLLLCPTTEKEMLETIEFGPIGKIVLNRMKKEFYNIRKGSEDVGTDFPYNKMAYATYDLVQDCDQELVNKDSVLCAAVSHIESLKIDTDLRLRIGTRHVGRLTHYLERNKTQQPIEKESTIAPGESPGPLKKRLRK